MFLQYFVLMFGWFPLDSQELHSKWRKAFVTGLKEYGNGRRLKADGGR